MSNKKLSTENETEALNKHSIMQAESEKQPYFKLSTNEYGKHWLFYKPSKGEEGKYSCWLPIDDEFYSAFNELQKAALGSGAAVGQRSVGTNAAGEIVDKALSEISNEEFVKAAEKYFGGGVRKSSDGHL